MFKKFPFITRLVIFLVLPVVIVLIYFYQQLAKSSPKYSGKTHLPGLQQAVNIVFDTYGSPIITATSDQDAYFVQGYLHASERMWQMELQRRLMQGRMSELMGISTVTTDTWMRTLGLHHAAQDAWNSLGKEAQQALTAYADGVNAWIDNTTVLPPEFLFFAIKPEPWKVTDSLVWQKALARNLGGNMYDELTRWSALKILSPDQLKTFYQYDPQQMRFFADRLQVDEGSDSTIELENWLSLKQSFIEQWSTSERFTGSNAWVVSGKHTRSGTPMLANDPHLGVQHPSLWYVMQMKGDNLNVSGMSLVGIPGIILGRNQHIAWGVTNLLSDDQDLYVLDIPLWNHKIYNTDAGAKPIHEREELIHIRSKTPEFLNKKIRPVTVKIRTTELGPIVSDVLNDAGPVMALRWSVLDKIDRSFEAFYRIQYAQDWSTFRSAAQLLKSPGLHFVYADKKGNIGSQIAGHIPIRGGSLHSGIVPQKAYDTSAYWQEYTPFSRLPREFNPESGFIVSANHQRDKIGSLVISHEWAPITRKTRITERLKVFIDESKPLTLQDMMEIQLDQVDLGARLLLPFLQKEELQARLLNNAPGNIRPLCLEALKELGGWNAEYGVDSIGASIYFYWLQELKTQLFSSHLETTATDKNNSSLTNSLLSLVTEQQLVNIITDNKSTWCQSAVDDGNLCEKAIVDSFYRAIERIKKDTRSHNMKDWQWGNLHKIEFSHRPFGEIKLLDQFFKQALAVGGSANTINVANTVNISPESGFKQTLGAAFRQVFELGPGNEGYYALSTGQSGHFLSPHYEDFVEAFIHGKVHRYGFVQPDKKTLKASAGNVNTEASERKIILLPKGSSL